MSFDDSELIQYCSSNNQNWHIVLPQELVPHFISCWYHKFLTHPGTNCLMKSTISQYFAFPNMKYLIEKLVHTCDTCQKVKPHHPCDG